MGKKMVMRKKEFYEAINREVRGKSGGSGGSGRRIECDTSIFGDDIKQQTPKQQMVKQVMMVKVVYLM